MNRAEEYYRSFFESLNVEMDEDEIAGVLHRIDQRNVTDSDQSTFDFEILHRMGNEPLIIEQKIIDALIEVENLNFDLAFVSIYANQMNAASASLGKDQAIVVDELFAYTLIKFFLTVFALSYDKSSENFGRCIGSCFELLDLQGRKHLIGEGDHDEHELMISLPENVLGHAANSFWIALTFLMGHEIYHVQAKKTDDKSTDGIQDELAADTYGYKILIDMIQAQKENRIPTDIQIFYETYYLVPVMVFEYFAFLDFYRDLCGETYSYTTYPVPGERIENIFSLFDDIPDDFDTYLGNELLNNFYESIDLLKEQIEIKKRLGKLEVPEYIPDLIRMDKSKKTS